MSTKPIVTILVPCYNTVKTLPATLTSIQKSKYTHLDVLIVDDGSVDTAEHIVKEFNDSRFRYVWKENEGLGLTRNYGINHALGEFIFFLDSDDEIYPDTLTNMVTYAQEYNVDLVSGVTVRVDFETGKESEWFRDIYKTKTINTREKRLVMFNDTLSTNKLYRVQMLKDKNIYFEEGLYEDKLFTAKLYSKADTIGLIDDRIYKWFIYGAGTSITTSKSVENFKGRQTAIDNLWGYIPEPRKPYQIAFYMNHDLLIYLREFYLYTLEEKQEIFAIAKYFIQKNQKYVYTRLVPASLNRACLDALVAGDEAKFIYTADVLSTLYQNELKAKAKV